jgi:outer membrane protein assembly factor BamD
MFRLLRRFFLILLVLVLFLSCASTAVKKDPRTDEEFFNKAMGYYQEKDYWQAAPLFQEIRDKFPLSQYAVLAELRLADIHYFKTEYVESEHYYEEFKRLHPSNPNVPYAIFQLGMCYFKQIETVDRDQTPAEKAADYFEFLITHYPTNSFTGKAMGKFRICRQRMFEHDFYIGHFYYRTKKYWAAKERFLEVLSLYPYVKGMDKVLFYLGQSYQQINEETRSRDILLTLMEDYPQSEYRIQTKALLGIPLEPEEKITLEEKQKKKRFILF